MTELLSFHFYTTHWLPSRFFLSCFHIVSLYISASAMLSFLFPSKFETFFLFLSFSTNSPLFLQLCITKSCCMQFLGNSSLFLSIVHLSRFRTTLLSPPTFRLNPSLQHFGCDCFLFRQLY